MTKFTKILLIAFMLTVTMFVLFPVLYCMIANKDAYYAMTILVYVIYGFAIVNEFKAK